MGEKTTLDKIHNPLCGHLPSYSKTRWLTIDAQVPTQVSRHISASHRVLYAYESLEVSCQKLSFENCHPRCVDNWQYTLKMNYVTGALFSSWSTTIWSSSSFSTSSSPFSTASSSSSRRRRGRLDRNWHFLHQGSVDAEAKIFIVKVFELLCIYADRFQSYIPLNFLIGFYVQQVPKLWSFPGHTTAKMELKVYLRPMRIFLEILLITFFSSWVPP